MGFNISRYQGRIKKEFEVEVVTPMFLGGADADKAELRAASLKGLLRFWWRATCGINEIENLKNEENGIFGDTSRKTPFSVFIENSNDIKPVLKNLPKGKRFVAQSRGKTFNIGIIDYLAFGLRDHKKGYLKPHFPSGSKFTVKFTFSNKYQQNQVLKAFHSLIHFGGMGARSRNGFGSLAITDNVKPSITLEGRKKSYTAVSSNANLFLTPKTNYRKWEDALSDIGNAYRLARVPPALEPKHQYENRRLIAKPIIQDIKSKNQRHAKPYFLHVGKTSNGKYYGQILCMPYQYYQNHLQRQYENVVKQMNKKIMELLAGGTK